MVKMLPLRCDQLIVKQAKVRSDFSDHTLPTSLEQVEGEGRSCPLGDRNEGEQGGRKLRGVAYARSSPRPLTCLSNANLAKPGAREAKLEEATVVSVWHHNRSTRGGGSPGALSLSSRA